ncbi:hypothetical protein BDA99DRAFT_604441 [Phascolomyces articulosus]|uniref:Uncharacterized protein n=1 Tax=Phascolomyces articulosus TaxID=60185 RepID=A0AAD5PEP1_9FUNG|nr:hypothetical protein BDA99DRAFT_604441 [Phascolomyces articulosus]
MDFCVVRLCRRLGVVCRAFGLGIVFTLWMNLSVVRLRGRLGLAVAALVWFWVSPRRLGRGQVTLLVLQGNASGGVRPVSCFGDGGASIGVKGYQQFARGQDSGLNTIGLWIPPDGSGG